MRYDNEPIVYLHVVPIVPGASRYRRVGRRAAAATTNLQPTDLQLRLSEGKESTASLYLQTYSLQDLQSRCPKRIDL